jgi:hypothetical protein
MLLYGIFLSFGSFFVIFYSALGWYAKQYYLVLFRGIQDVYLFYSTVLLSIVMMLIGFYIIFRWLVSHGSLDNTAGIIGYAAGSFRKFFLLSCVLYVFLYLFLSGSIVFQPDVDFLKVYGFSSLSIYVEKCCGPIGSVPKLIIPLNQVHIAFVFAPINMMLMPLFSFIFGLNLSVSYLSISYSRIFLKGNVTFLTGTILSLFTSCPSCAVLFLFGSFGGLASFISVSFVPFQLLMIYTSLPILLFSLFVTSYFSRKYILSKCRV